MHTDTMLMRTVETYGNLWPLGFQTAKSSEGIEELNCYLTRQDAQLESVMTLRQKAADESPTKRRICRCFYTGLRL